MKWSCSAEAQEPIKLCDHFKKVCVYDLQIHLPDLFKCLLNCSLKLLDTFASPLTRIQLSPRTQNLDKTRDSTVKLLPRKCCLMESKGFFYNNILMLVKNPQKSILLSRDGLSNCQKL